MYVEILCPRCSSAVAGRSLRSIGRSLDSAFPEYTSSYPGEVAENDDDSLTETDIVEAELTVSDEVPPSR